MSYRELNRRANRLAHHLIAMGVGPEVRTGLCLEPSRDLVIAILAILKAGGAYVPLDPTYPPERLSFMLEDSKCKVLLTQERLTGMLPVDEGRVVCVDKDWPVIAEEEMMNPESGVEPGNLAYAIYTSGSTGKPKGAIFLRRSFRHSQSNRGVASCSSLR